MPTNSRRTMGVAAIAACGAVALATTAFLLRRRTANHTCASPSTSSSSPSPPPPAPPSLIPADDRSVAMEILAALKQRGNTAFQRGEYDAALHDYQSAVEVSSALGADADAQEQEHVIRANIVMALIKQQRHHEARLVATTLLEEPTYIPLSNDIKVKLLYRRGMASKALMELEAASADFRAAIHFSVDQKNPLAEKELAMLQRR